MNGAAVFAARHAGHLLRRRNRHGRQYLSWAIATACARRCNGAPTATPAFRRPIRSGCICRSIIDPEYLYETVNVETQQNNPQSLWWWIKRLIAVRHQHTAFGRGIARISLARKRQSARLHSPIRRRRTRAGGGQPLAIFAICRTRSVGYEGYVPIELFGHTSFPRSANCRICSLWVPTRSIGSRWSNRPNCGDGRQTGPENSANQSARQLGRTLQGRAANAVRSGAATGCPARRWFAGKAHIIQNVTITDNVLLSRSQRIARCKISVLAQVDYADAEAETYLLPLGFATRRRCRPRRQRHRR